MANGELGEIRVLHVDDEPDFAELTASFLERAAGDFEIETATSASDGIDHLAEYDVDCIVSDYDMPGQSGIEFLEAVREEYSDLPFILFTGKGSEEVASDAIGAGATDYLQKGPGSDQYDLLANRIRNAVSKYRSERAQEWLAELADNTDRILISATADWEELLFVSSAYEEIWGCSIASLNDDPTDFITGVHPDDRDQIRDAMETVAGGESIDLEVRVNPEEDYGRWVRIHGEPITDESGTVVRIAGFAADISDERHRLQRRECQRDSLLQLATDDAVTSGAFQTAVERVTEIAADVLRVSRVNVWLVDDESDGDVLTCVDHYDSRSGAHSSGMELAVDEYPAYFEALESHQAIDAADARADPRTAELADDYLDVHDIGALLDGTLRSEGDVVGMVCHEQVGETRAWTDDEIDFASDIADIVHRALRNRERTERERALEQMRDRMEFALEVTDSILWAVDPETMESTDYGPVERLFGIEPAGMEMFLDEVVHPDDRDRVEQMFRSVRSGENDEFNVEYRTEPTDGEVKWIATTAHLQESHQDGSEKLVGLASDVTDRVERSQELQRQNERLEEFVNVVSHDLRNPLHVSQGKLELLEADCESDHLDGLRRGLDRIDALIDDLLELARQGDDVGERQPVDVGSLAQRSWKTVDTGEAGLEVQSDQQFYADPSRLKQLLENLYRNAIEHGGDEVNVTVGSLGTGFYVADDGPGIPENERDEVFDAGYSTSEEGTGFGLSIVKQVVEAHGWNVRLTSSQEGGARFEITGVEETG